MGGNHGQSDSPGSTRSPYLDRNTTAVTIPEGPAGRCKDLPTNLRPSKCSLFSSSCFCARVIPYRAAPHLPLLRRGDLEAVDGLQEPRLLVEKLSQRQLPPLPDLRLLDSLRFRVPPLVELVVENLNNMRASTCEGPNVWRWILRRRGVGLAFRDGAAAGFKRAGSSTAPVSRRR